MKNKQGSTRVVNLATYTSPQIKSKHNENFVTFGDKNQYFNYLIDRFNGSPTNNAIINGISSAIFGKGLDATDSNKKPDQYAKMISLFKKEEVRKLVNDLKLLGQCAIQVIYSKDRKTIAQIAHMPVQTLAMEKCDDEGNINGYFYYPDWEKYRKGDELKRFPAFGTSKEPIEIIYIKQYYAGYDYFSPVDYQGCLQYAELEEEISNFHINNIKNGLAPSMLINFNNGIPDEEAQELIEQKIREKYSGSSSAGRFILSFNDSKESAGEIIPVQLSDAHNQYQFLSDESMRKILIGHRVVSPMLYGVKDNTGLGNNADELVTASTLMDNVVIRPFQELLLDAFDKILSYNKISLNLYFKTLQPLEFTDVDNVDQETKEEETGVKMSADFTEDEGLRMIELLEPDDLEDWEEVDEADVEDEEPDDEWAARLIKPKQTSLQKLATIIAKPSGFSYLDKSLYKIRYRYAEGRKKSKTGKSRKFCQQMMSKSKAGNVYRLEDIDRASREGVNSELGHKKQPYDLFKYKGGVYCHHVWKKVLFRAKKGTEKGSEDIKDYKRSSSIPKTYNINPRGTREAVKQPVTMPNNGHHPNYKK